MSSELASVRATCACSRKLQHQARFRVLTAIACSASGARASLCLIPFRCFAMLERRMNPSWWILAALALLRTSWHLLYCCIQAYLILACAGAVTSGQPHHLAQGQKKGWQTSRLESCFGDSGTSWQPPCALHFQLTNAAVASATSKGPNGSLLESANTQTWSVTTVDPNRSS